MTVAPLLDDGQAMPEPQGRRIQELNRAGFTARQ
jgi:hypothetical protein